MRKVLSMLLISMALPFMWLRVMANRSSDHCYFSCRILSITAPSGYALLVYTFHETDGA